MERMEMRHVREVQIEVQEAIVELEGALRSQTRQGRQSEAELDKVEMERRELRDQLDVVMTDNRDLLKTMGRERRQHDVEQQTIKEQCDNLKSQVLRRNNLDTSKKKQHKEAMGRADALQTTLELEKKALAKEEGQWRWKCAKQERLLGVQQGVLSMSTLRIEQAQMSLLRKESNIAKREHTVAAKEETVVKYRKKVEAERKVLHYCFHYYMRIRSGDKVVYSSLKTIRNRTAKVALLRKRWHQLKRAANTNLKNEKLRRSELEEQMSLMVLDLRLLLYLDYLLVFITVPSILGEVSKSSKGHQEPTIEERYDVGIRGFLAFHIGMRMFGKASKRHHASDPAISTACGYSKFSYFPHYSCPFQTNVCSETMFVLHRR